MVDQITQNLMYLLCELFYLYILKLILFALKFRLKQQPGIKTKDDDF